MIDPAIAARPKLAAALALQERALRASQRKLFQLYPDTGPLRRELYQKQLEFFRLGKTCQTRAFIAANRVGKTYGTGGFELVLHLTGLYPEWWEGWRVNKPIRTWCAGDTRQTTRDILQQKLLGNFGSFGTGLIPADRITRWTSKPGVPEAVETVWIKSEFGGDSLLVFKSFDQGRESFQGTEQDVILLDEESDEAIRNECALRLMTTGGRLMETFTPLKGITPIVMSYMPNGYEGNETAIVGEGKALVMAGWEDVPHLGEDDKRRLLADTPPHLRDARSKGIPSLGAGAIYPVQESEIVVEDFALPAYWPRAYGLDVGWNRTAAIWAAWNRDADTVYLYAEHYRGQAEPSIHAEAVKARGKWIPGVIDPASRGRGQKDGAVLLKDYRDLGLRLSLAKNAKEAGIYECWQRLSTGRLKVFKSCRNFLQEYRMYRRDENGKIVDSHDHLMDAFRYLILSGLKVATIDGGENMIKVEPWVAMDPSMGY